MSTTAGAPIVVGVDGSPPSYAALDWAVAAAHRRHLPLRVVYVAERSPHRGRGAGAGAAHEPPAADVVARAEAHVRAALPHLDVSAATVEGDAAGVLVEESAHAVMVVVGNRGAGGFRSLLTGSVGVQTASHARCPVVVVRPRITRPAPGDTPHHGVGRVVVGVDGSELSQAAIGFAVEEASSRGVGLTAVHAWWYPVSASPGDMVFAVVERHDLEDEEQVLLAESLAGYQERYPDVPVRRVLAQGNAAAALVHESLGAELLVVGSRGRGGFAGLVLGSVSHAAIQHAGCPVAVIRQ
jgi:nucleotide-binding universal stress UspA family protein